MNVDLKKIFMLLLMAFLTFIDGSDETWEYHEVTTDADGVRSVFAIDIDGDGDTDIVSGSINDDTIAWYENADGTGETWEYHEVTTDANGVRSVFAIDIDGDGDIDIVFGSPSDDTIAWYENIDGTGETWEYHEVTTDANFPYSVFAIDIDGDGDIDIVSSLLHDNIIAWYENTDSTGETWEYHEVGTNIDSRSVFAIDIDGDNDIDIVFSITIEAYYDASYDDDDTYYTYDIIAWYENIDGTDGTWEYHEVGTDVGIDGGSVYSVFSIDIDDDGDIDIAFTSYNDDTIAWYENIDGTGEIWEYHEVTTDANGASSVFAIDVDNDGDIDIVSGSSNDKTIAWYENSDGSGETWIYHEVGTNAHGVRSVFAIDIDGDGNTDIVSGSIYDDTVAWYGIEGIKFEEIIVGNNAENLRAVFAIDVDGNGDIDIVSASVTDDTIAWYENTDGSGEIWEYHEVTTDANGAYSVFAIDIDGDGDIDIVSGSMHDDTIAWYENTDGSGEIWEYHAVATDADSARSVFAIDIDGDGDIDIVSASSNDDTVAWYENTDGSGEIWIYHAVATDADSVYSVFAIDIDGDGDIDIVSASYNDDTVAWYENTDGSGETWKYHEVTTDADGAYSVFVIDIDGDGDIDIVSASLRDDTIAWHENIDGTGETWIYHEVGTNSNDPSSVFAIDFDGDGDIDIVSGSSIDDTVAWHENINGIGETWTYHEVATDVDNVRTVFSIDIDGDGDIDIVSGSWNDGTILLHKSF